MNFKAVKINKDEAVYHCVLNDYEDYSFGLPKRIILRPIGNQTEVIVKIKN